MKSVPSKFSSRGAERVVVGNRSIVGWKMEGNGDLFCRVFDVTMNDSITRSVSSPSLTALSRGCDETPVERNASHCVVSDDNETSLTHFRYRFAIRVKRRFSYTWFLSCWIVRDLMTLLQHADSDAVALPIDEPLFPYMPGSQSSLEPEAEFVMNDKNQIIATHTAAELKRKTHTPSLPQGVGSEESKHNRSESALSNQSTGSCVSYTSAEPVEGESAVSQVPVANNAIMYPYVVPYPISMCCVPGTENAELNNLNNQVVYHPYYPPGAYQTLPQMMVLPPMDAQTYQQYISSMGIMVNGAVVPPQTEAGEREKATRADSGGSRGNESNPSEDGH